MAPRHCRRRSAHRGPGTFLKFPEAESTADAHALVRRLKRAVMQADVLAMPDVTRLLEQAIDVAEQHGRMGGTITGEPVAPKSIGQHEPEPVD